MGGGGVKMGRDTANFLYFLKKGEEEKSPTIKQGNGLITPWGRERPFGRKGKGASLDGQDV